MRKITVDRSGTLRRGIFYSLNVQFDDECPDDERNLDWVVAPRTPTNAELVKKGASAYVWVEDLPKDEDRVEAKDWKANPTHITSAYYRKVSADLGGGSRLSPLLPTTNGQCFAMSDEFNVRLRSLRIRSTHVVPIEVTVNQSDVKKPKLWSLQFTGRARVRLPKLGDIHNSCPHCSKGTLMCEECGLWYAYCPKCRKQMVIPEDLHAGEGDGRIPFERQLWNIVEGATWDGSDLIQAKGAPLASRRFIDWLLRVHAAPFYAEPVQFCVDGMSDEQLQWLKELEKPLEA